MSFLKNLKLRFFFRMFETLFLLYLCDFSTGLKKINMHLKVNDMDMQI